MGLPKLSLVSIGVHDEVLNWVAKYKPVSIIVVNERGQARPGRPWEDNEIDAMRRAMDASPKTLWIFRSWPDGIGEGKEPLPWRVVKCLFPFEDMPNPLMGHSYNEPGFPWIGSSGDARKLTNLEYGFADVMHAYDFLSMNFCFSESHILKGNLGLWEIYADALPYVDALGFNEYDWPWVFTSRDQGYKWRIGHWEHQLDRIGQIMGTLDQIPPVIIGEGILDGKIWTNALPEGDPMRGEPYGYQNILSDKGYIQAHQAAHDDTYHKPGVFSHHTFCYAGRESEWNTGGYHVGPILPQLGQLIEGQVYWEEKPMDVWKNVRPDVARFKKEVGRATRDYNVPIPDYKGIPVSPAKVMAVIIANEKDPCDPNFVNEFDEKKDGIPTGRKLHAVGLCGVVAEHTDKTIEQLKDPYTNIIEGLRKLKSKLNSANGNLRGAYYYYTGGAYWPSMEDWIINVWFRRFVPKYNLFWDVDLEQGAEVPAPDWEAKYKQLRIRVDEVSGLTTQIQSDLDRIVNEDFRDLSRLREAIDRLLE